MNKCKSFLAAILISVLCVSGLPSFAQTNTVESVPAPLEPWVDWVLDDIKDLDCPIRYDRNERNCAWPSKLSLQLNDKGGRFSQQWQLYAEASVQLPGEARHWPQNVSSNGEPLIIESLNGSPYVRLKKGQHTIDGEFVWGKLPKTLTVTPASGLVDLSINNKDVSQVRFNNGGQLWLTQSVSEVVSADNLDMQVFRRIVDGHPIKVETMIKLRVAGKQRTGELNSVLLDGFIATEIRSDLPARLEDNNQLMVQMRPGEWTISIKGRALNDTTKFTMPETQKPWPQQEVWVFVSDNNMRQVQVVGVDSIDPNQTRLPNNWKGLPAYLLAPKQTLALDVKERGVGNVSRNELNLEREMWLDFDGNGYSIRDQINGEIYQTRLNVLANIELGRVSINNEPQFITREANAEQPGVEVRQKQLILNAESRYTGAHSALPVNGWQTDLQQVNARLNLPPGWSVLAVTGTDNLPNTWLERWSLLDLFLIMIIMMSVRHFFGWKWAGLSLLTLIFTWQQAGAPNLIWLNLLAVTALLNALPKSKYRHLLDKYRMFSLLVLAVILLGYTINTVRSSVYPQLQRGYAQQWQSAHQLEQSLQDSYSNRADEVSMPASVAVDSIEEIVVTATRKNVMSKSPEPMGSSLTSKRKVNLKQIDPNSLIQSGPGLPSWRSYSSIRMYWAGPVKSDQVSRLILLSPLINLIINILGIILMLCLTMCFLGKQADEDSDDQNLIGKFKSLLSHIFNKSTVSLAFLLSSLWMAAPIGDSHAQTIPDQQMLQELKQRMTKPPECLNNCAQIQKMAVDASSNALQLRLRVHAVIDTTIPLPASQGTWLPEQILVDGNSATSLYRDAQQVIWLSVKEGIHDVVLNGPISQRISLSLPLPLKPNFATWQSRDDSWTIEGINPDGVVNPQLQFTRVVSEDDQQNFQTDNNRMPTFVKVNRQLRLGLDWYVQTTITRVSPRNTPLNIRIPLLENEQLLNENLTVINEHVDVNFSTTQSVVSWSSKLLITPNIVLKAANDPSYLEMWSIDVSPIWRTQSQGLPISRYLNQNAQQSVVPLWQPWPGEQLTVEVDRPVGVDGQMVTIQGSHVDITVGKRVNDVNLSLAVRSSRGVQHQIKLPDNADVQELMIDGVKQRVQFDEGLLSLTLKPGKQDVIVKWREQKSASLSYSFPNINLQLPSVNANASLRLPRDHWVIWVNGPLLGPAVLFWSALSVLLLLSIGLGWSKITPLNAMQWFLLAVGLSQISPALMVIVVACFVGLSFREKLTKELSQWQFNLMQVSLIILIIATLGIIIGAVANGLLGRPDMQISGNGSTSYFLKWYQDRAALTLPDPNVISVPLWVYRVLMLLWAMWLAVSLLKWIKWGWNALSFGEFWRTKTKVIESVDSQDAADQST